MVGKKLKKDIDYIRKGTIPVFKRNDVVKAGFFGSIARGEIKKGSDIDFIVKFRGRKSLIDLVNLRNELKCVLKKEIDILTYKSINPLLKKHILDEEVKIL